MTDQAIQARLLAELRRQAWWREDLCSVTVENGIVIFGGVLDFDYQRIAARVAAETVPGVRGVVDRRVAHRELASAV